ncbi:MULTISPECIES: lipopolysaccharide heptosyltransferase II [Thermodesulfovibrio]|uniref:lipopolysaccharide heptosyltransferase II n=1 Tax=Thermodesulfovibrio yellowstonii (strain ATCC 51303 / DSM 11347 / YP87) TaxID=289376 RepID=B5YKL7_THEYD|nr:MULTISPECIES: lipopolysaccharide heptosyltransferase II [Thermodesulfovibrio]ACI20222.1 ADP-heptose--LPS heptosyltransferase II [Thermodesulfovibrio yellowstonii DSM 11347]MDI6865666.1 lipopolysaccharide heptosyltransferase II [Thermodesulfovibrio yellowstonii]
MENILIRGVNWLGDAVMSLPAVRAIRKLHPTSNISILIKEKIADLFRWENTIDEVIIYSEGFTGKIKTIKELKNKKFKRAYLLQNALDAALITTVAGIPERVGWNRDCRRIFLTHPVPYHGEDRKIHHIDYFFEIPKRFNPSLLPDYPWINPSLKERLSARKELKNLKRPILALSPGAKYGDTKKWEAEKFIEVSKKFIGEYGSVVLFGSQGEDLEIKDSGIYNFIGKTSLRELICLLAECDILLCNDSGIMHLGYALGVPLVAIFGSTSPELTGPPKFAGKVIRAQVECSPCFKNRCPDIKCMKSIEVEDVWSALNEIIPSKKAVFFDRDGTLCKDANYLSKWEDFEVFPFIETLKELKNLGFLLIGISNQSGIARGIIREDFVKEVNQFFIDKYGFDDFFYCPHHPDERCFCRKPNPGMPLIARYKYGIDFRNSYVVGDKDIDMQLAQMIGAKGILISKDAKNLKEVVEIIKRDINA